MRLTVNPDHPKVDMSCCRYCAGGLGKTELICVCADEPGREKVLGHGVKMPLLCLCPSAWLMRIPWSGTAENARQVRAPRNVLENVDAESETVSDESRIRPKRQILPFFLSFFLGETRHLEISYHPDMIFR